jgi:tRNA/rRNA methyltransferase
MISVVLIQPETSGNVGAIARVMQNFDLSDLYLVEPKIDYLDEQAKVRSKHGIKVLESAKILSFEEVRNKFDMLVATTAKIGNDLNLNRVPMLPSELANLVAKTKGNIAIVFGRESTGLTNKEIEICDFSVTIPATQNYPTLNISHACTILFYELFKTKYENELKFDMINRDEKNVILEKFNQILDKLDFSSIEKKQTQEKFLKKFISKSFMTKKEAYILLGFLKKLNQKIKKRIF